MGIFGRRGAKSALAWAASEAQVDPPARPVRRRMRAQVFGRKIGDAAQLTPPEKRWDWARRAANN